MPCMHLNLCNHNDFTHWHWLKLLTNKHEETILEAFKEYKAMAEAQHPACKLVTI